MRERLLIFDFDGTLVDSEVLSNQVLSSVLTGLGYPLTPEESRRRFTGMKMIRVRESVQADLAEPLSDRFEDLVRQEAHRRIETELEAVAGAAALLAGLDGPRCIASNSGHRWIALGLERAGLRGYFETHAVFSAADVGQGKPAPDLFLHAARIMRADPALCVVIEDSLPGVRGGVAAGMTVLGFAGASHVEDGHHDALRAEGARLVFDDLCDLPGILSEL